MASIRGAGSSEWTARQVSLDMKINVSEYLSMSRERDVCWCAVEQDHVDTILAQWARERPAVDVAGMAIVGRISRLERLMRQRLDDVFTRHDLESWEFDVLATLLRVGSPHRLTPGELQSSMMITSGAMTNRIDRLEQRGFVTRGKNPSDGRQVLVTLTARGRRKVDAALTDHAANELALIDPLDDRQRAQLADLLRTLTLALARPDQGERR
jgi:DNA-binding MarR family transcriptional regulator